MSNRILAAALFLAVSPFVVGLWVEGVFDDMEAGDRARDFPPEPAVEIADDPPIPATDAASCSVALRLIDGCGHEAARPSTDTDVAAWRAESWRIRTYETIMCRDCPNRIARDAYWSGPISLWVSVNDDGGGRTGLAESYCLDASAAGKPDGEYPSIRIWDHVSMQRGDPRLLTQYDCTL